MVKVALGKQRRDAQDQVKCIPRKAATAPSWKGQTDRS